ncbi:DUF3152 domain-containing protein [Streptomyces spinosirectus]|uniref:DUF3152 domain-containing protein n=1 Tax=Streptomyces TaxID=1883 RepID=UPI001C9DE8F6|nr:MULTISPECIES: DUF3152 domain-containing protein [Streptomyces]MBY8341320.1 DUF3152 domain-containing protein [Streptomyces plumbidurans]UIR20324.1 DUF3152 domain-containing protein [Streptomyces spinosirectus]
MGRHSRRGSGAAKGESRDADAVRGGQGSGSGGSGAGAGAAGARRVPGPLPGQQGAPGYGPPSGPQGMPGYGPPSGQGMPAYGPRPTDGTPARGVPRLPDGTPARGVPRFADGTPARGVPRFPDGTPARGVPRFPDGTPAHGTPRLADGTSLSAPQFRGGHPEQREAGGGWGELRSPGVSLPRQRQAPPGGPRQDYVDAFDDFDAFGGSGGFGGSDEEADVFAPRGGGSVRAPGSYASARAADPYASVTDWDPDTGVGVPSETDAETDSETDEDAAPTGVPAQTRGSKGRTFTGIAAAAVTTVLAVVVAGQVANGRDDDAIGTQSATDQARDARDSGGSAAPSASPSVATLTYSQAMAKRYPLSATLKGSGKFDAVPGVAKAPGKGQKYTYRVDVEQGLGLDGELFARAVQTTLNDKRSWAHDGERTFERIHTGKPDFVITLASPGTTAKWCAKSGLDTGEENVSCDSAATERVMINAYRWAQGSKTYGDHMLAYRQMLINHEVGHRLGHGHVNCTKDGELAPVMQQQTKFLDHDGIHCRANPWPYPGS